MIHIVLLITSKPGRRDLPRQVGTGGTQAVLYGCVGLGEQRLLDTASMIMSSIQRSTIEPCTNGGCFGNAVDTCWMMSCSFVANLGSRFDVLRTPSTAETVSKIPRRLILRCGGGEFLVENRSLLSPPAMLVETDSNAAHDRHRP
jgi:hypothetical protein